MFEISPEVNTLPVCYLQFIEGSDTQSQRYLTIYFSKSFSRHLNHALDTNPFLWAAYLFDIVGFHNLMMMMMMMMMMFKLSYNPSVPKDFQQHAVLCDRLLGHYSLQWRDRSTYWVARDRSQLHQDLICLIIDSYDKAKCLVPRFPFQRTPKRTVYEQYKRTMTAPLSTSTDK